MRCYIEVSRNHGYSIGEVMRRKFDPEIQLLIRYYSNQFYIEHHEMEKLEKEQEKLKD